MSFSMRPHDAIDLETLRQVLVIKLRHHGDVLLTTPVFHTLKQSAPHIEIDALIYEETCPLLQGNPDIRQVYAIDKTWKKQGIAARLHHEWHLYRQLLARDYDLLIHLTEHKRGAWLSRMLKPRYAVAPYITANSNFWQHSFTHLYHTESTRPALHRRHTVEQNLDALRRIGIQPGVERSLILQPDINTQASIAARLKKANIQTKQFIVVHPGSRWLFKCWSVENNIALINQLLEQGKQIIYTAAPDTRELTMRDTILKDISQKQGLHDFSGSLSLQELAVLIGQAQLFIGVDSAPMHIAAAMQTPVIALFGPSGEYAWAPWQVRHHVIVSEKHACRPCGIDGCGGGKISECLTQLPVTQVINAVNMLLKIG